MTRRQQWIPGLEPMPEDVWQDQVLAVARQFRWRVAHFRPALTKHGWRTPVAADGKGFPDLLLVRDRVLAVELKADAGKLTADQQTWLDSFTTAGIETHVWRPADYEIVITTLRTRKPQEASAA